MDALNKHMHTNIQNFIVCSIEIFLSHNLSLQTNSSPDELAMFRGKDREYFHFCLFFFFFFLHRPIKQNTKTPLTEGKSELLGQLELEVPKSWKDLNFTEVSLISFLQLKYDLQFFLNSGLWPTLRKMKYY